MKYKNWYFAFSLSLIIPGVISLMLYGLKPAIDFTGGTILEIKVEGSASQEEIRALIGEKFPLENISASGEGQYTLKLKPIDRSMSEEIKTQISNKFGSVEELRFETVGPSIGKELIKKTLYAVLLAATTILLFVIKQFNQLKYGVSAILAMFHDTLILVGTFSVLGHFYNIEVDTLFVTAVLTILSFSIHDTIVVYDRIRETQKKNRKADFKDIVNISITDTLGRSINNSMTIVFMLLSLWLLGGETIKWFVFALLLGTLIGTYSSTFTAAPLLLLWDEIEKKKKTKVV